MQPQDIVLSVEQLHISFAGIPPFIAVDHLSFELKKGQTLAIVGESGSGKSLTALSLMGLLPPGAMQRGNIHLATKEGVFAINDHAGRLRGSAMGMVFQEPMSSLNPVMRVGKQITESIILHQQVSAEQAREMTIDWLGKVQLPQPRELYNRYPHQLSGGQKQRVMIAMAMCNHPVLLIADEPTTALDVTVQKEVMMLMQLLQQEQGTAMIFITHDLALAARIADEVIVMQKGRVMEHGKAHDVLEHPQHTYTRALLACRPSAEHKGTRLAVVADHIEDGGKQVVMPEITQEQKTHNDPILEVHHLDIWFETAHNWSGKTTGYFKAVNNVSFALHKGEILGLVGESGCGKSTISRSLMGLLPVHKGQVLFNGKDLATLPQKEWRAVRKEIQLIFQDPYGSLNPRMNIGDMLMEPLTIHNIVPRNERRKEALRLLDIVQLPADSMKRYPHQFSGGQRQRLGIARALAVRPRLLVCDESVSALDVSVQAQILNLLKDLQSEFDLSYLFISHDLNVVHYISDRVMVMQAGKIVETGSAEQVLKNPVNEYTRTLVEAMP